MTRSSWESTATSGRAASRCSMSLARWRPSRTASNETVQKSASDDNPTSANVVGGPPASQLPPSPLGTVADTYANSENPATSDVGSHANARPGLSGTMAPTLWANQLESSEAVPTITSAQPTSAVRARSLAPRSCPRAMAECTTVPAKNVKPNSSSGLYAESTLASTRSVDERF